MTKPMSPAGRPLTSDRAVPVDWEDTGLQNDLLPADNNVDQTRAQAGGDVVGRDKIEHHHHATVAANPLGALLEKLKAEVAGDQRAQACLDELQHYHQRTALDGVVGLKAKLERSGRNREYDWALVQKEKFAKILAQWSLYASAQELFVYLLSRADFEFNQFILPKLEEVAPEEINALFAQRIVQPTVAECTGPVLRISHSVAMGMVYWLAEQCFIRWHK